MPDFQIPIANQNLRRRKRWVLWGAGVTVTILCVVIGVHWLPSGPSVAASTLVLGQVQQGIFAVTVQAPGTLKSLHVRYVTAAVPGTVAAVLVQPGDPVQPGTILLRLVNSELQHLELAANLSLVDAQATLVSTRATLDNELLALQANLHSSMAEASAASLKVQAERGLEAEHVIAELDYRTAVLNAENAQMQVVLTRQRIDAFKRNETAQIAAQQAKLDAFKASVQEAQENVSDLGVTAGLAGVVQTIVPQPGQTLALGAPIAQIASVTALKAELAVAPSDAGEVEVGQKAEIQLNNANNAVIQGVVSRVSPAVIDNAVAVDVTLPAHLPEGTRPDLAVLGVVSVTSIPHTLFVTRPVGAAPNSTGQVYEMEDGGSKAILVPVKFGAASATMIQILSGLSVGAQIIVSDTSALNGASSVRVS